MDTSVNMSLIAAVSQNGVIGKEGNLPWRLSADMKQFVRLTTGNIVICGRKTHDSILKRLGHHLDKRFTVVLTRQESLSCFGGCFPVFSWWQALVKARELALAVNCNIFVIGGEQIYKLALPYCDEIYLTTVDAECNGDAFFPVFDRADWEKVWELRQEKDEKNEYGFTSEALRRVKRQGPTVLLENAREESQSEVMKDILEIGACPFCPENLKSFHRKEIINEGRFWVLTESQWPYKNTAIHLLIIAKKHWERLSDIEASAGVELFEICRQVEEKYKVPGGALTIRFGDPKFNSSSVRHLHAHIIVPAVVDDSDKDYLPLKFKIK